MRRTNLKIFRIKHNLTQNNIAQKIGCGRDAYNAIENGMRNPSYEFIEKLQAAFDIPNADVWELLEREK